MFSNKTQLKPKTKTFLNIKHKDKNIKQRNHETSKYDLIMQREVHSKQFSRLV